MSYGSDKSYMLDLFRLALRILIYNECHRRKESNAPIFSSIEKHKGTIFLLSIVQGRMDTITEMKAGH